MEIDHQEHPEAQAQTEPQVFLHMPAQQPGQHQPQGEVDQQGGAEQKGAHPAAHQQHDGGDSPPSCGAGGRAGPLQPARRGGGGLPLHQLVQGEAEELPQLHQLVQLRHAGVVLPLGHRLPGHPQRVGHLPLGEIARLAELIEPLTQIHGETTFLSSPVYQKAGKLSSNRP